MWRYKQAFLLIVLSGLSVSCSSGPYPISSPYYDIPAGTELVVNRPLSIAADSARVYLQHGKVVHGHYDQYEPHCWFLSWKVLPDPQTIPATVFNVLSSQQEDEYVSNPTPVRLAMDGDMDGLFSGDGPTAVEKITTLKIHSDSQPDIREFSCNYWGDPGDSDPLTVAQMQEAAGSWVKIKVRE